jgi:hypothetical protein
MKHQNVYELSRRYGPPGVDLRQARIADDYGDEAHATMPICHKKPEDVTRDHLDYYGWIYPFLKPHDLLFYLYPIAREHEARPPLECVDSFLYSLNAVIDSIMGTLTEEEREALRDGMRWMWQSGGSKYADWSGRKLQKAIGIEVE